MAASSSQSCCPPGSHPELVDDKKRDLAGAVVDVDGLPCYYVAPAKEEQEL